MSLGDTLLKVAIGVAIAKGLDTLTEGGKTGSAQPADSRSAGRGTPFDPKTAGKTSGLEDILKDVMGSGGRARTGASRQGNSGQAGTGEDLDALLEELSGKKRANPRATAPKGGLDELLGQLTGTGGTPGANAGRAAAPGGIGDLLEQMLGGRQPGAPVELPEPEREKALSAALMLRAVIQAVKCDGELDETEKARLMKAMGEADAREVQAVNAELQRPVDVEGLARAVPPGLEPQIYLVSLTAINLDQRAEADYLHQLAGALDLSPDQVNAIHDKVRAPRLYR